MGIYFGNNKIEQIVLISGKEFKKLVSLVMAILLLNKWDDGTLM